MNNNKKSKNNNTVIKSKDTHVERLLLWKLKTNTLTEKDKIKYRDALHSQRLMDVRVWRRKLELARDVGRILAEKCLEDSRRLNGYLYERENRRATK